MKPCIRILLAILLVIGLAPSMASASSRGWLNVEELKALPDAVILDARSAQDYAAGHLPGAVHVTWQSLADMNGKPGDTGWGTLLPPEQLAAAIGALGVSNDSHVVIYSASPAGWGEDGRIAWTLRSAGLEKVSILDGGIEAWRRAGGEISTEAIAPQPAQFTLAAPDVSLSVDKEGVKASLATARIIDSRSPEEFAGAQKYGEARGGHLPGAINIPWTRVFNENGTLLDPATLAAQMRQAGISPEDEIIAYCTAGIRSAHLVLALREAGFAKARNYDASFHEWAGDSALPLE